VISILGILAYFVIADYNGEIKRSRVRVAAETLYSELQDLSMRVVSGSYDIAEDEFYCWGLQITVDGISRVIADYDDGCDYVNFELESELIFENSIESILVNEGALWGAYVFFDPPYSDLKVFDIDMNELSSEDELLVSFESYGYSKSVSINPLTGNFELVDEESSE